MPDSPRETAALDLAAFPPVSTADWLAAIEKDLKGADFDKRLVWRTDEGLAVRPFYRAEDLAGLEAQTRTAPGAFPYVRGAGSWAWEASEKFAPPAGAVRADLLHEAGATAVQEVGFALAEGVDRVAAALEAGATAAAARAVSFAFAVGGHYFLEIAKLRAARLVWAQAVAAFSPADPAAGAMHAIVRTSRANKSRYDADTNLLRVTTEAMAAVIGGCAQLTVEPAGFEPHLAVNVQRVLREEAHLGEVADPAGGSYYVEALTDGLARAAWALFQDVERAGGYRAHVASGALAAALAQARAAREKAIATRRRTLVGVNNYPNAMDTGPTTRPMPPEEAGPAPAWRMAEPIERVRRRTERHAATHGRAPVVLLLTRGDLKMRMARATFSRNFFGCGGFTIVEGGDLSPADLVVLCGADADYPALTAEVVPAVNVPVIVAGHPADRIEALRAAGVAGFIHVGSDLVATLTEWQDRLGMEAAR